MTKSRKMRLAGIGSGVQVPGSERHALGQYYTPAIMCELICRIAITSPSCIVMDPSCGDGEFLVAAVKRLEQLNTTREISHVASSDCQVFGIEINDDAACQARSRIENIYSTTSQIHVEVNLGDFFNAEPGRTPFPPSVDAVIGNPPYIRQELIKDKARIRAHLSDHVVDERADLYVYFFSRAEQWLANGGRIGFLTSERYLDTQYGAGLQQFFLDRFKIIAVIAFDKQIFADALVGTVITILEKESREERRSGHIASFVRVKRAVAIEEIEGAISTPKCQPGFEAHDTWDAVLVPQHVLAQTAKWRPYLIAQRAFFELKDSPRLVELGTIAAIKRGITSGANEFFYRREQELDNIEARYPGLRQYFRPLLKAIGQSDWLGMAPADTDWYVLDVHGLVETCKIRPGRDVLSSVKEQLRVMGHGSLVHYIEDTEAGKANPSGNATCTSRAVWFDLGTLPVGGIGFPKEYWTKFICPLVDPGVALDSRVYVVVPKDWPGMEPSVDKRKILAALLNADLTAIFYECQGRVYAGQALDRASCMVYEANKLRIVDPRQLSKTNLHEIQSRFDELLSKERSLVPRKTRSTLFEAGARASPSEKVKRLEYIRLRRALNEAILDAIGLGDRAAEMERAVQQLVESRRKRGGDDVQVLIDGKS